MKYNQPQIETEFNQQVYADFFLTRALSHFCKNRITITTKRKLSLFVVIQFLRNSDVTRVYLHRPKMLIIQFHTLSLWKNASHTNFIHFCKMSLIEFQRYFIVVLVMKLLSLHKKKEKKGMKKMLTIQFPYMEIV